MAPECRALQLQPGLIVYWLTKIKADSHPSWQENLRLIAEHRASGLLSRLGKVGLATRNCLYHGLGGGGKSAAVSLKLSDAASIKITVSGSFDAPLLPLVARTCSMTSLCGYRETKRRPSEGRLLLNDGTKSLCEPTAVLRLSSHLRHDWRQLKAGGRSCDHRVRGRTCR
jgi:hypothetical protein